MAVIRRIRARVEQVPLHPFLFAVYPVLAMLAKNANEVRLVQASRPMLAAVLLSAMVFLGLHVLLGRLATAGVLTTLFMVGFLSYGHLYDGGRSLVPGAAAVVRHRYLLPAVLGCSVVLARMVWRRHELNAALTPVLNLVGLLVLIVPIFSVARAELKHRHLRTEQLNPRSDCSLPRSNLDQRRDIYYLILDAYAREDVLAETYKYDNGPFLDELRERGFFIAEGSQSNYASTGMSLASSLNMNYLPLSGDGRNDYWAAIANNEVRRQLECLGYRVVAFDSGYDWSTWRGADTFLSPIQGREGVLLSAGLNSFEVFFVNSTLLRILVDAAFIIPDALVPNVDVPLERHRRRIEFTFDFLESDAADLPSPKFVFAHIIAPHSPFIFGPEGETRNPGRLFTLENRAEGTASEQRVAYTQQLQYVNSRLLRVVDGILSAYPPDRIPIIIVQSDHGPTEGAEDRMRILNAYRMPDQGQAGLYATTSPVNSFRVVFNTYFEADFELLPDVSCYSSYSDPFDYRVVPNPGVNRANSPDAIEICK